MREYLQIIYNKALISKICKNSDFPDGPVVKDSALPIQGARVWSPEGELGSHMPRGVAKKRKNIYIQKLIKLNTKKKSNLKMGRWSQQTFF